MATLNIHFNYMMLFLRTANGMDVLLPADLHRATITQNGVKSLPLPPGSRVWITINEHTLSGRVGVDRRNHAMGGQEVIVSARQLFRAYGIDKRFVKREHLRGQTVTQALNARVELNGGHLEAASCDCPHGSEWATAAWTFPGKNFWNKPLTDRALYRLPIPDGASCRVHVARPNASDEAFDVADGTHFIIANGDLPMGSTFEGELTEFQVLYDLYDPPLDGLDVPRLRDDLVSAAASIGGAAAAAMTPEIPICPPLDDCEDPQGNPEECEKP